MTTTRGDGTEEGKGEEEERGEEGGEEEGKLLQMGGTTSKALYGVPADLITLKMFDYNKL